MLCTRSGFWATLCAVLACLAALTVSKPASAYPWMIRHHYTSCGACHYDPSGAGPITGYGRAVADSVIRMGGESEQTAGDLPASAGFLFGAIKTPDWLDLGGDVRLMGLAQKARGVPLQSRLVWMQLDGSATINVGDFTALGTLGYMPEGALGAALTRGTDNNLVSRQHWIGYQLSSAAELTLRVGRMNLPFGIRSIEHTLWARKMTRTNINDTQQYGASLYVGVGNVRGEVMGIAGNLQLRPDRYRERGYSGYIEAETLEGLSLGVSSLVTHRSLDPVSLEETWRQVHGAFARWATPYQPLVLMTEWDYTFESSRNSYYKKGLVSYVQADWEPLQGMHFIATGEANKVGVRDRYWSYGGWLSYAWFFAPHCDLRLDGIYQSVGASTGRSGQTTLLLQAHVFL
ncbi:MAG TPA: hypothetical protein VHB79_32475 [Polyangiaceae bacterium]|nr:hypothetical protein [Polyangiaceae bacterium]